MPRFIRFFPFRLFPRGVFLGLLLLHWGYAQAQEPQVVESMEDRKKSEVGADTATVSKGMGQLNYEMSLRHATVVTKFFRGNSFLKSVEENIKKNRALDTAANAILPTHLNTLLSINAPFYEVELPELFAQWAYAINLLDKAEKAGLYKPKPELNKILGAWRTRQQIATVTNAAPWITGPAQVVFAPELAPITIPAGFRFLSVAENQLLRNRIYEVKKAAMDKYKMPTSLLKSDHLPATGLLMPVAGKWSLSIGLVANKSVRLDIAPSDSTELLRTLSTRLNPMGKLHWRESAAGNYSEQAVRWLIAPEQNKQEASIRWASTNGVVSEATGIDFGYLKLGANQLLVVTLADMEVAEYFSTAEILPEGKIADDYHSEKILAQQLALLTPFFNSLRFTPGKRLEDARPQDSPAAVSVRDLITGPPTLLETGVQRIIAEEERKSNFWYFLKDHPRIIALLLGAVALLLRLVGGAGKAKPE